MNEQTLARLFAQSIIILLRVVINCASFPMAVILRKDMGERYCSYLKAICAFGLIHAFILYSGFMGSLFGLSTNFQGKIETITSIVYWMCFILNRLDIREKRKNAIRWHSYYIGRPRFFQDSHFNQKFVLPGFGIGVGLIICFLQIWFNIGLGGLLLFSSTAMFCEYLLIEYRARIRYLDAVDMEIEADHLSNALKGEPVENTNGFFIPNILTPAEREKEGETRIEKMYSSLDPKLKSLVQDQELERPEETRAP